MDRLDLVIWTYNSASTLDGCLTSIESAIPPNRICHKIAVDGGSKDQTWEILAHHDWSVHTTRPGIATQANKALSLVDTDYYASFEHDAFIQLGWFERIFPLLANPRVAIAQGFRCFKGSELLKKMDDYQKRGHYPSWANYSLDNTLYRTRTIRELGGYPYGCPYSTDSLLREQIIQHGYNWLVDAGTITYHYKPSYWQFLRHSLRAMMKCRTYWFLKHDLEMPMPEQLLRTMLSPISAARIAGETHSAPVLVAYPLMRYSRFLVREVTRDDKRIGLMLPPDHDGSGNPAHPLQ
jgi:glycosyltransferase involved in cell wall biosynthesis